ncbi:MAG: hypothetical protein FRX49_08942 [Trebouxia sp. A1-2]|nr:MAG: hypothetical protein FRX49_08942 [Trebouxia sp. A1-2]
MAASQQAFNASASDKPNGMTGRAETLADPWAMYTRYYVVLAVLKAGRMINGSIVQKKMGMRGLGHAKRAHLQY